MEENKKEQEVTEQEELVTEQGQDNTSENNEDVSLPQVEMIEKDKYVRLYSEFDNYKKRTQKEKEDFSKTSNQKLILEILPTLDNFERAGELPEGIKLVFDNLKKILEKQGVKAIDVKGLDFNSDVMEALTQIQAGDEMKGKVVDVIEKGYELNGKIIRYSKVIVGA